MTQAGKARVVSTGTERGTSLTFFLLALLPVLASFFLTTDGHLTTAHIGGFSIPLRTVCALQFFTGYKCPVNGMTRTFAFMGCGQIAEALRMSPPGVLLYGFCLFEIPLRGVWLVRGRMPRVFRVLEPVLFGAVGAVDAVFFLAQFFR